MKVYDVGVVGGCASGMAAAINAKRIYPDYSVVIFEKLPRLGKKILSTGNGRCNLTNINAKAEDYNNPAFAENTFLKYSPDKIISFFESLGLITYSDECGRVYPRNNNASSVLDALRYETEKLGIEIITDTEVESITHSDLFTINGRYKCKNVIIATGGKASPSQGSDGSGYKLAKSLCHSITPLCPALVPLNSRPEKVKALKGIRASGVKLNIEGSQSKGEILFTENGISGIAAMELASAAEKILRTGDNPTLYIDLLPEFSEESLKDYLIKVIAVKRDQPLENLLSGILPKHLGVLILKNCNIYYGGAVIEEFSDNMLNAVVDEIKNLSFEITGTKGFANAQVTSGGIKTNEIDSNTMKSKICDNLYFCGEIIDIDGRCGGYNLQWAFASGLSAGELG